MAKPPKRKIKTIKGENMRDVRRIHRNKTKRDAGMTEKALKKSKNFASHAVGEPLDVETFMKALYATLSANRAYILSKEQRVAAVLNVYELVYQATHASNWEEITSTLFKSSRAMRWTKDPIHIMLRSTINYDAEWEQVQDEIKRKHLRLNALKSLSRDTNAIRFLLRKEYTPEKARISAKKTGWGLDTWARLQSKSVRAGKAIKKIAERGTPPNSALAKAGRGLTRDEVCLGDLPKGLIDGPSKRRLAILDINGSDSAGEIVGSQMVNLPSPMTAKAWNDLWPSVKELVEKHPA